MRHLSHRLIVIVFLQILFYSVYAQGTNDHIFLPSPQAKATIDFDSKGFLVNGRRTFLVSAGMEYARVPHELWEDRLLRLRRAGFNCVEIYTFWNFHEPSKGVFDFKGDHDLDAFLKLVKKMGLYAIVRVGPYYCAEWDNGGYPLWLKFEPGLKVREPNAPFEKYTGLFFDRLIPIVAANQINHGGSVILVQLENEHPAGWGTAMPNTYFEYLQKKALSLGLEVPYFFSGLHHASDPESESIHPEAQGPRADPEALDDPTRPNPWLSTEFWSVWYDGYGSTEKEAKLYERRTWKIIAHGGNGYNLYMAHGGSNFGYTNNDEDAASYDYGAAVGQGGDLRPVYYTFKEAALFARSFADILENSVDGTDTYHDIKADTPVRVSVRKSPSGSVVFLDNPSLHPSTALLAADTLPLDPGEILPLVKDYALEPGIRLILSEARLLTATRQGREITLVAYGEPGNRAKLLFSVSGKVIMANGKNAFTSTGVVLTLDAPITHDPQPGIYSFSSNGFQVRVLVVNRSLADRTWVIDSAGQSYIVCGPRYAGKLERIGGRLSLVTEASLEGETGDSSFPVEVFTEGSVKSLHTRAAHSGGSGSFGTASTLAAPAPKEIRALRLSPWQRSDGTSEAKTTYDDSHWLSNDLPLQMGTDGDLTADAWYRTKVKVDTPGEYTLLVEGSDRGTVFVDGKKNETLSLKDGEIPIRLSKGLHVIAVFTAHDGRDKLPAYIGPIDSADRKGLFGKALLVKGGPPNHVLEGWRVLKAAAAGDVLSGPPSADTTGWAPYSIGQDAFGLKKGFGWFQVVLPNPPPGATQIALHFASVDENATVFVGAQKMLKHEGWNAPFDVLINDADTLKKPILLTLFVENYSNEGGIDKPVRAGALLSPKVIKGWRMRGGSGKPGAPAASKATAPAGSGDAPNSASASADSRRATSDTSSSGPCWWKTSFSLPAGPPNEMVWRVVTTGLGHGSVWVNGHNLGRYPEKIPVNGLYIPPCWMHAGSNTLQIFEEDGRDVGAVTIEAEVAASRSIRLYSL